MCIRDRYLGVKTLAEARKLDAAYIRDKSLAYDRMWGTVVDGHYVVGSPMEQLLAQKRHMVPLLMGNTSDEFLSVPEVNSREELEQLAQKKFGARAGEFLALCKGDTLEESVKKATFSPIELAIRTLSRRTAEAENAPDNYYYVFDGDIPGEDHPGTFHSCLLYTSTPWPCAGRMRTSSQRATRASRCPRTPCA